MTTHTGSPRQLENTHVPVQVKLAAAWTSYMFLAIYVDYLQLYRPGVIDDILAGVVWKLDISQTFVTGALASMAIPSLMILLSTTLPARANRTINLVVASLFIPYSVFNLVDESWLYFYGLGVVVEVIVLAVLIRSAWNWPRAATHRTSIPTRGSDRTTVADLQPASGPSRGPTR